MRPKVRAFSRRTAGGLGNSSSARSRACRAPGMSSSARDSMATSISSSTWALPVWERGTGALGCACGSEAVAGAGIGGGREAEASGRGVGTFTGAGVTAGAGKGGRPEGTGHRRQGGSDVLPSSGSGGRADEAVKAGLGVDGRAARPSPPPPAGRGQTLSHAVFARVPDCTKPSRHSTVMATVAAGLRSAERIEGDLAMSLKARAAHGRVPAF